MEVIWVILLSILLLLLSITAVIMIPVWIVKVIFNDWELTMKRDFFFLILCCCVLNIPGAFILYIQWDKIIDILSYFK